jgi:hypothetical protein
LPSMRIAPSNGFSSLVNHSFDVSASACTGDNILFYNGTTGSGAIGKLSATRFLNTAAYPAGSFSIGWTAVSHVDRLSSVLFYNKVTGRAAVGALDHGTFTTTKTYKNFSLGWSNILYAGMANGTVALPFFYNKATGSGAVGFDPTERNYQKGHFSTGWSHTVWNNGGILFYNTGTGSAAVAVPVATAPGIVDDIATKKTFAPGSFLKDWTHITATGARVFFYNYSDGSAAIGRFVPNGQVAGAKDFVTDISYGPGEFTPHWTHVVNAKNNLLLFYNSQNGAGAIGQLIGSSFTTTKVYPSGSFQTGFTHIVCAADTP